jgi:hypothetical protein
MPGRVSKGNKVQIFRLREVGSENNTFFGIGGVEKGDCDGVESLVVSGSPGLLLAKKWGATCGPSRCSRMTRSSDVWAGD